MLDDIALHHSYGLPVSSHNGNFLMVNIFFGAKLTSGLVHALIAKMPPYATFIELHLVIPSSVLPDVLKRAAAYADKRRITRFWPI